VSLEAMIVDDESPRCLARALNLRSLAEEEEEVGEPKTVGFR
jgi:hypothetical protein